MKASILDLRHNMKDIFHALDRNEPVTLTHRGKDKAVIQPVNSNSALNETSAHHPAFGIWENCSETEDVEQYINTLRKGRFQIHSTFITT